MPDILHFLLVFVTIVAMTASIYNITFGHRVAAVAEPGDAVLNILQYTLVGDAIGNQIMEVRRAFCRPSRQGELCGWRCPCHAVLHPLLGGPGGRWSVGWAAAWAAALLLILPAWCGWRPVPLLKAARTNT